MSTTTATTTATTPATTATNATKTSSIPDWMNFHNADGTWNPYGILFWMVMVAILIVVLQFFGVVTLFTKKQLGLSGQGEEFYSDL